MQNNSTNEAKTRVRAWLKILKTSNFIEKNVRERLRNDHKTTLPRFDVMSALYRSKDGLKMSELSGVLKVSNGNITGIIDRLVQDGHVERTAIQGDRRAYLASLTKKGSKQFQEYALEHETWINEILSDISVEEANIITKLLTSITDNGDLK
jgi:DNA-binding MarR family transcriptional regulator